MGLLNFQLRATKWTFNGWQKFCPKKVESNKMIYHFFGMYRLIVWLTDWLIDWLICRESEFSISHHYAPKYIFLSKWTFYVLQVCVIYMSCCVTHDVTHLHSDSIISRRILSSAAEVWPNDVLNGDVLTDGCIITVRRVETSSGTPLLVSLPDNRDWRQHSPVSITTDRGGHSSLSNPIPHLLRGRLSWVRDLRGR